MNANRRKEIQKVIDELEDLKSRIDVIKDEEEEYRDNMPENLSSSERFEKADAACENLDYAYDGFDEIIDNLNNTLE